MNTSKVSLYEVIVCTYLLTGVCLRLKMACSLLALRGTIRYHKYDRERLLKTGGRKFLMNDFP